MSFGFVILSHRVEDWKLLARLLPRLRELGDVEIAVHHDTYQSPADLALVKRYGVRLLPPVQRTRWSHISKFFAIIRGLECLFRLPKPPRWYATLSPTCYPIKPASVIANRLQQLTADFYVDMRRVDFRSSGVELDKHVEEAVAKRTIGVIPFISRRRKFYWRSLRICRPRSVIPFGENFQLYHGSDWFVLGQRAVAYLLDLNIWEHPVVQFYLTAYPQNPSQAPSPVETVIQSLLGNAHQLRGQYRNWHYIDWRGTTDWHPQVLTEQHWTELLASDALWARKLDLERSAGLRQRLDTHILGKE